MDKRVLEGLGQQIINELGKELIKQQHKATGELIASLDYKIREEPSIVTLSIEMNEYGTWVNIGRKKGAAKVPIQNLVDWVKQKGIETNNKKAISIAYAIQKTIQREGVPTINSRRKGKKVGFVDDVIKRMENEIERQVLEASSRTVEVMIDNFVKRI